MSQHQHLYDARWRKARLTHLASHPLCWMCLQSARITAATVVDHDPPHRGDSNKFWDTSTWRSLCKVHHDSTKQRAERRGGPIFGCDVDGMPLDPTHPWHQRK